MQNDEVSGYVLDSSALLAALNSEAGGELVEPCLAQSTISSVNWSETFQKAASRQVGTATLRTEVQALGVTIVPFTVDDAEGCARLWERTRSRGLSLGDRACLALGLRLRLPVLTADRAWTDLDLDMHIIPIRQ